MGNKATIALLLEIIPGAFFHVFGIGVIYSGNTWLGVIIMLSYWFIQVINLLLCYILIGFVTTPLTWLAFMIGSSLLARNNALKTIV